MATNNSPEPLVVPVKRYDIILELEDILAPLTQTTGHLTRAAQLERTLLPALDPQIALHLEEFTRLVTQLREVVNRINRIAPSLLASKAGPPPPHKG